MPLIRSVLHMAWIVATVIPWGFALLGISFVVSRTRLWWFAVNWFRLVIWGTRVILGIEVRVIGLDTLTDANASPAVLLSKHQSTLETLLIPTLMLHPLAFVFKRELLRIPFFGWSMARLDMIHINRESRSLAMKHVMDQGKRMLGQGTWVILFPEGTRMPRGTRGTYQTAGTRLAVEAGAPVVPIALTTGNCWPRTGFVKHAGVVHVSIGKPIPSSGREAKELMREAEAWIEAEMRRLDPQAYAADPSAESPSDQAAAEPTARSEVLPVELPSTLPGVRL